MSPPAKYTMWQLRRREPESGWAKHALKAIIAAIDANRGKPVAEVRAAIDAAYPFGPRRYHPYRQWLRERSLAFETIETPERFCEACGESLPPWTGARHSGCELAATSQP